MSIAEKLQKLMDEKGISAYKLSKDTGISYTGINKILNGKTKHPRLDMMEVISNYFDKQVDFFTGNEQDTKQNEEEEIKDFKNFLTNDTKIAFDGVELTNDDKRRINDILTAIFWDDKKKKKERK
ncbi:helix-turn-helix transcriptional regulator [Paenibacillus macerans]|uniref:helix-turn-helix domain-containing protein n=1 Tax=Paenibacillus macerans TaxID=44252 RepID=UPI00203B07D0|nr:helix-turn-helix transcriptional regulator [Paenibacillus macerans]MCM3701861.1 helix-turn-helix transcriptional regulator [Paenibacillus macerans]